MNTLSLDIYDRRPEAMNNYLRHYGWHFNKKMCDFATSQMFKGGTPLKVLGKESIDSMLDSHDIVLNNNKLLDYVYVANMCRADFLGSSIIDETHVCRYIKDVIDDEDGYDGIVFNRWYADMCKKGVPIDWESML